MCFIPAVEVIVNVFAEMSSLKVLFPEKVCAAVVMTPDTEADAEGIATAVPSISLTVVFIVGPLVVPSVQVLETVVVAFVATILPSVSEIFDRYSPVPPPTSLTSKV